MFKVFEFFDKALVGMETYAPKASINPAVWPSEASAELINKEEANITGKCHRASYFRMIGEPQTNPVDAIGARRFRTGRAIELDIVNQARESGLFIASGVKTYVEDIQLPLELDLVVLNPENNQGVIIENKSYYGYFAGKEIKQGRPKLDNLMQLCVYINEFQSGAFLKERIADGLKEKADNETKGKKSRNRIEAIMENVAKMNDGPIIAKLCYEARDDCATKEFDISIYEDFDGSHYPCVDGAVWKEFTIESIYNRYDILQKYWIRAREAAKEVLSKAGIHEPSKEKWVDLKVYQQQLAEEMRKLPVNLWAPAEYEYRFSKEKVLKLRNSGKIGEVRYKKWLKGKALIGNWSCAYCPYKKKCLPTVYPDLKYMALDLSEEDE